MKEDNLKYIYLGIVLIVMFFMVKPLIDKWNTNWEIEREEICLPYTTKGIVSAYEGNEHCSVKQINEKKEFWEYYCKKYNCYPVLKSKNEIKKIYGEYNKLLLIKETSHAN